jgi:hypothetical protein
MLRQLVSRVKIFQMYPKERKCVKLGAGGGSGRSNGILGGRSDMRIVKEKQLKLIFSNH